MKFNLDERTAYIIADNEDALLIYNCSGFVMDPVQMQYLAKRILETIEIEGLDEEIERYNQEREEELNQSLRGLKINSKEKKQTRDAYIYLFECNGLYKIGYSRDVERRLQELNNRPYPVKIIIQSNLIKSAYSVEQNLHAQLKPYQINGEWYDLPKPVLEQVIDFIGGSKNER